MRTFAQRATATQQPAPDTASLAGRARPGHTGMAGLALTSQQPLTQPTAHWPPAAAPGNTRSADSGRDSDQLPALTHAPVSIQTKLSISMPGDAYEQEADRVADRVMRLAGPGPGGPVASRPAAPAVIQRQCEGCEEEEASPAQSVLPIARQTVEGEEEEYPPVSQAVIRRKAASAAPPAATAPPIADRLATRQSAGEPLPAGTRGAMEHAFGHDFSRVRIHRDGEAGDMSRQLSALAFTHGSHIYFGHGTYDPAGASGKRLLAHELTHVVQQGQAAPRQDGAAALPAVSGPSAAPAIQRFAIWRAGAVNEVNNLANCVVNGTAVGVTWPTLNGSTFWSTAAARALMKKPTLSFSAAATGGVNAKVASTPTNVGSFDETVLAKGPWSIVAPKATIGGMLPTLAACTGAGDSTFQAIGDPSDKAMFEANRRHEDHHATDHEAAFNGSLVPWDSNLIIAEVLGFEYNGATNADAEAALYAANGGTPDQVADNFMNACAAAVVAYHGTAAGGPVGAPTDPKANADCSTSSAKYTNPS